MKKRILIMLLAASMAVSCMACGGSEEPDAGSSASNEESVQGDNEVDLSEETEPEEQPAEEDGKVEYLVTVVDEEGNPIAGAMVQLCLENCFPGATDETGVARFSVEEEDYKVSFLSLPAGYTYSTEEEAFYFDAGSTEMTITLKKAE